MSNYRRGTYLETRAAEELSRAGFYVIRSAGSHGQADVVALRKAMPPVLVQCKTSMTIRGEEWNALHEVAAQIGATAILATWNDTRRKIVWREITGVHLARTKSWPYVPWDPYLEVTWP